MRRRRSTWVPAPQPAIVLVGLTALAIALAAIDVCLVVVWGHLNG